MNPSAFESRPIRKVASEVIVTDRENAGPRDNVLVILRECDRLDHIGVSL